MEGKFESTERGETKIWGGGVTLKRSEKKKLEGNKEPSVGKRRKATLGK